MSRTFLIGRLRPSSSCPSLKAAARSEEPAHLTLAVGISKDPLRGFGERVAAFIVGVILNDNEYSSWNLGVTEPLCAEPGFL